MPFDETFKDLRTRRRIPMRLFEERVGISTSYIHGIEREGLLPSPEKLERLAAVFVEVAKEQEAADPEADARRLSRERERSAYISRLGLEPALADTLISLREEPALADTLISLRELDPEARADLAQPLSEAITLFSTLDQQERGAIKKLLNKLIGFLESMEGDERRNAAVFLADAAEEALEDFDSADLAEFSPPAPAPQADLEKSV